MVKSPVPSEEHAERPGSAAGRWGQLTYASLAGSSDRPGGWQVKQTSGELTREEKEYLQEQLGTRLDLVADISSFPTHREIAALPRRLVYVPDKDRRWFGYWHTVSAGADATGRPGNVFIHAALERRVSLTAESFRPIELWRSPDWLCPFGAEDVEEAVLTASVPRLGESINRDNVLDFVLDESARRVALLSVLVDAVDAALKGGRQVVLAVASVDHAALWIAAVSYLVGPGVARELGFSTYERADTLTSARRKGVLLASVPDCDLERVRDQDVVLFDESEDVVLGVLGSAHHRSKAGAEVKCTEWSVLTMVALVDHLTAVGLLREIDTIASRVGDEGLEPAWPLALAMAGHPSLFRDALRESAAVIAKGAPAALRTDAELFCQASKALEPKLGGTTADAWDALEAMKSSQTGSPLLDLAAHVYVRRAVHDDAWLTREEGPAPVWPVDDRDLDHLAELAARQVIDTMLSGSDAGRKRAGVRIHALRLLDFAVGCRIDGRTNSGTERHSAFGDLCGEIASALWVPSEAAELIREVGCVREEACARYLRPAVCSILARVSDDRLLHLSPCVYDWLFPSVEVGARLEIVPCSDEHRPHLLEVEFALYRLGDMGAALATVDLRYTIVAELLSRQRRGGPVAAVIDRWAEGLPAGELTALSKDHPGLLGLAPVRYALRTQQWSGELGELVGDFRSDRARAFAGALDDETATRRLARLRLLTSPGQLANMVGADRWEVQFQAEDVLRALLDVGPLDVLSNEVQMEIAPRILVALTVLVCNLRPRSPVPVRDRLQVPPRGRALLDDSRLWKAVAAVSSLSDFNEVVAGIDGCLYAEVYDRLAVLEAALTLAGGGLFPEPRFEIYGRFCALELTKDGKRTPMVTVLADRLMSNEEARVDYFAFEHWLKGLVGLNRELPPEGAAKTLERCKKLMKPLWDRTAEPRRSVARRSLQPRILRVLGKGS